MEQALHILLIKPTDLLLLRVLHAQAISAQQDRNEQHAAKPQLQAQS
jgi:hypothetical protein